MADEELDENLEPEDESLPVPTPDEESEELHGVLPVSGMFENWFLDYASYVILERAVPAIEDGLKPVQRRILHSMREMDDGRFHKVANVIGQTMQYHPHGDAAIGDALVGLGQKDIMIETQGNWGDVRTGDSAAAPRYIEARLSKFALEVAFNPDTTTWQLTYDGRKKEPVTLPMKFPLLLAQGVEGIAVGLSTKVLPHNFIEIIDASVDVLKGKKPVLYPDFLTGGLVDVNEYNGGVRGSKVRVRARVEVRDKKTLAITEIPFATTTTSLIDSILKANDKGKIKLKKVVDNTAKDVEILIELAPGVSPDITIDALYAFTDCEISISPNTCVIIKDKPHFISVEELLAYSTRNTVDLLKQELEIRRQDLLERILFSSLEKIFIENRIYRDIEECESWTDVLTAIDKGLEPYKQQFYREITVEDITKLTEIKIKRISKYDAFKADEQMRKLEEDMKEVEHNLAHLTEYAIKYFQGLKQRYSKGRERKTEIRSFDVIKMTQVAAANEKLYVDKVEGFIGYGIKKAEYVCDCSDIDDIIVFREDGKLMVTKIAEKNFVGKGIIHVDVWKKNDDRMVYNMVYYDAGSKRSYAKRFNVTAITRDKEYDLTKGVKGSKVHYFTANPNAESEVVTVTLTQGSTAKKKVFDFDFGELAIKGRSSQGNIISRYPVRKILQKSTGESTLGGLNIWLDESIGRLNTDERGRHLGEFFGDDKILVIYKDGHYELTGFELTNRYQMKDIEKISRLASTTVISALYFEGGKKTYYVKRFNIETISTGQRFQFISEESGSWLAFVTTASHPIIEYKQKNEKGVKETVQLDIKEFCDVKGWKALGKKLTTEKISNISEIVVEEPEENLPEGSDDDDSNTENHGETSEKISTQNKKSFDVGAEVEWEISPAEAAKIKGEQGSLFGS